MLQYFKNAQAARPNVPPEKVSSRVFSKIFLPRVTKPTLHPAPFPLSPAQGHKQEQEPSCHRHGCQEDNYVDHVEAAAAAAAATTKNKQCKNASLPPTATSPSLRQLCRKKIQQKKNKKKSAKLVTPKLILHLWVYCSVELSGSGPAVILD
jgi:hypothetical protein